MSENKITNDEMCEFLGWYAGDGCISINERYSEFALTGDNNDEFSFYENVIIPKFNRLFTQYLKKPVVLKKYTTVGVCGIYLFDKTFVKMLQTNFHLQAGKKTKIEVPLLVQTANEKKHFLRGLCDTDGSIYFCKSNFKTKHESLFTIFHYKPKIKIATISDVLIKQVYDMLCSLGFSPRLSNPVKQKRNEFPMYGVVLDTKKDVQKWLEDIGFRSQKHLTKIKIWEDFGFCPPHTTLRQRIEILNGNLDPLTFYPKYRYLSLDKIKEMLGEFLNITRMPYKKHK
jgi:hypothetical protein